MQVREALEFLAARLEQLVADADARGLSRRALSDLAEHARRALANSPCECGRPPPCLCSELEPREDRRNG